MLSFIAATTSTRPTLLFLICCCILVTTTKCDIAADAAAMMNDNESAESLEASALSSPQPLPSITYGVDISFPMHHKSVSTNYAWLPHNTNTTTTDTTSTNSNDPHNATTAVLEYQNEPIQPLGNRQELYENFIQGCVDFYNNVTEHEDDGKRKGKPKGDRCLSNERDRIRMTLEQPQSVQNYTENGFVKLRAPSDVFTALQDFYNTNIGKETPENWIPGNIYTNHWDVPTYMLSVEDDSLLGGGKELKQAIWNLARDTMEAWTGYVQAECSLYGIRIYKRGAMLAPHVDRLPLVSSAILNVAQGCDVEPCEPWPLEVIGHDGIAHNVTMVPGDLVLYESHSIIHGRQHPFQGDFMASVFIHFEPVFKQGTRVDLGLDDIDTNTTDRYGKKLQPLPPYVVPDSPGAAQWRRENPRGRRLMGHNFAHNSTELHQHAITGNLMKFQRVLRRTPTALINATDSNGWTALHEAVRGGYIDIARILLDNDANLNARAKGASGIPNTGVSPLALAKKTFGVDSPMYAMLLKYDAATTIDTTSATTTETPGSVSNTEEL